MECHKDLQRVQSPWRHLQDQKELLGTNSHLSEREPTQSLAHQGHRTAGHRWKRSTIRLGVGSGLFQRLFHRIQLCHRLLKTNAHHDTDTSNAVSRPPKLLPQAVPQTHLHSQRDTTTSSTLWYTAIHIFYKSCLFPFVNSCLWHVIQTNLDFSNEWDVPIVVAAPPPIEQKLLSKFEQKEGVHFVTVVVVSFLNCAPCWIVSMFRLWTLGYFEPICHCCQLDWMQEARWYESWRVNSEELSLSLCF